MSGAAAHLRRHGASTAAFVHDLRDAIARDREEAQLKLAAPCRLRERSTRKLPTPAAPEDSASTSGGNLTGQDSPGPARRAAPRSRRP